MTDLPFTAFWAERASEYKEAVVKRALEHLGGSGNTDRKLASSINENIKIPGFRNSSTAPHSASGAAGHQTAGFLERPRRRDI